MSDAILTFSQIKEKIREHLKTALDIERFQITLATQEKDIWRVNVEYHTVPATLLALPSTALFSLDARTGQVKEFKKNVVWNR